MAIIYSYQENEDLLNSDMLVGTATTLHNGKVRKVTKNFNLGQLKTFINGGDLILSNGGTSGPATLTNNVLNIPVYQGAITLTTTGSTGPATLISNVLNIPQYGGLTEVPTLNEVLTAGNTSTLDIFANTFQTNTGYGLFDDGTVIGQSFQFPTTLSYLTYYGAELNTWNLPEASGTIALTSDIPVVTTPTLDQVLTAGNTSVLVANVGALGIWDGANVDFARITSDDNIFYVNDASTNSLFSASQGSFIINKDNSINAKISTGNLTSNRTYYLPNTTGTFALISDIPSLTGYVQTTRTLTINGTTYDLSANRTWNVGTVTDVTATGQITSTGGATPVISTLMHTDRLIGRTTAGSGVMEEISVGAGLTLSAGTLSATSTGGGIPHATATGTDTYAATVASVTSYADGDAYLIRFTNANTTVSTLNINSLGAVPLYRNNDGQVLGGDIWSGGEMLCVYNSGTNTFQCIGTSPNSLFAYVTNEDSVAITKGQPVFAFGGTGDRMTVKRAYNTSDATSAQTVGVVVTSSIAVNQKGIIIVQGLLDGLSILPTASWADGDPIYLGSTPGSITNVKQYAPNHLVYLGVVTSASNGSAGRWYVRVQNGYELDELHNVQAQSPTVNDILYYFGGSPGQWKTASIPTVLGYTPFQLPSLTSGSVIFSNGTTLTQDNSNFFWDDTNNRLGLGTNSPASTLHVNGNMRLQNAATGIDTMYFSSGPLIINDGPGGLFQSGEVYTNTINGKVGIGAPSTTDILQVHGDIMLGEGTTAVERLRSAAGGTMISFDPTTAIFSVGGTSLDIDPSNGVISTALSIGINTTTPATLLDVNGVITASGGDSTSWNAKQEALVSGTNIKTINGNSVLGSGNLTIGGGGGGVHAQKTIVSGQYTNLFVVYSTAPSPGAATTNRLYCMPFFPNQTFTIQSLVINVTALSAGGLAKVLIFSDVDGVPTTKLYESADFDCSTTGNKTASVSFTFTAGVTYWLGFVANNGTNTFSFLSQGAVYAFSTNSPTGGATYGYTAVTFASIPSTLPALAYQSGNIPLVSLRKA